MAPIVLAINKSEPVRSSGRTKADTHPSSKTRIDQRGTTNMIFVPVGNWEEDGPGLPEHLCRSGRPGLALSVLLAQGSLVAMDVIRGRFSGKRHTNIGMTPIMS